MTIRQFGQYVKGLREKRGLSLRKFCRLANLDPSNWSKVERGLLSPPRSRKVLNDITSVLLIPKDSDEWHMIFDMAAIGHIPVDLVGGARVAERLPIFFRIARGAKLDPAALKELMELLKPAKRRGKRDK
jgi:transcriptional regulator with XRE-family HTH domain